MTSKEDIKLISEAENFFMPWGKHKGMCLDDLPTDYLTWLAENVHKGRIAEMADALVRWREDNL